jgi:hypothetical protein
LSAVVSEIRANFLGALLLPKKVKVKKLRVLETMFKKNSTGTNLIFSILTWKNQATCSTSNG